MRQAVGGVKDPLHPLQTAQSNGPFCDRLPARNIKPASDVRPNNTSTYCDVPGRQAHRKTEGINVFAARWLVLKTFDGEKQLYFDIEYYNPLTTAKIVTRRRGR